MNRAVMPACTKLVEPQMLTSCWSDGGLVLQVKKTNPKAFDLKYIGSAPSAAQTLKATLTDEFGRKVKHVCCCRRAGFGLHLA